MKSYQITIPKSLNLLICLFPLSFILGNFYINALIVLISCLGIAYYKKDLFIFENQNDLYSDLLVLDFLYLK